MFYIIAILLIIISLFFFYSAISAFNELRHGIKKKVQAKPYMVVLFLFIALLLIALAIAAIIYQSTWDQHWNNFWLDKSIGLSEETKIKIYGIASTAETITFYLMIALAILFTLSLVTFRKLSTHLFVGTVTFAVLTFLSFITIQYTEPGDKPKLHEQQVSAEKSSTSVESAKDLEISTPSNLNTLSELDKAAISRYFNDKNTDVLNLSAFLRKYFRIPREISNANIDQLRQYSRGLTEMKQILVHIEISDGAEDAAKLTQEWLQQEINIVMDCLAEKRESGILGLMVKFNNTMADLIFDRNKKHHATTDKLRTLRGEFVKNLQPEDDENLKSHFSFIKQ